MLDAHVCPSIAAAPTTAAQLPQSLSASDTAVGLPPPYTRTLSDVALSATNVTFGDMTLSAWMPTASVERTQDAANTGDRDTAATLSFPLPPDSVDISTARISMHPELTGASDAGTNQQVETARPIPHEQPADNSVQPSRPAPHAVPESEVTLAGGARDVARPADSQGQVASAQSTGGSGIVDPPEAAAMGAQQHTQIASMLDQLLLLPTVLGDSGSDPVAPAASGANSADAALLSGVWQAQPNAHSPPVAEAVTPLSLVAVQPNPSRLGTAAEPPAGGEAGRPMPILQLEVLPSDAAPQPAGVGSPPPEAPDSRASAPLPAEGTAVPVLVTDALLPEPDLISELQPGAFDEDDLSDPVSEAGSEPSLAAVESMLDTDVGEGDRPPRGMEAPPDARMGGVDGPPCGADALPPGHPLLARAQAALRAQLQATRLRLEQELSEKRKALKACRVPGSRTSPFMSLRSAYATCQAHTQVPTHVKQSIRQVLRSTARVQVRPGNGCATRALQRSHLLCTPSPSSAHPVHCRTPWSSVRRQASSCTDSSSSCRRCRAG